jgi:predicted nucleic acid-binding protein
MADSRRVEAVADTSFLIALQWQELLETLGQVHTRVLVPERVWDECAEGASEAELAAAARIGIIQRTQVSNATLAAAIGTAAEGGEAEVIALALESGIILVLMDDYRGRKVAQRLGLKTRGISVPPAGRGNLKEGVFTHTFSASSGCAIGINHRVHSFPL